MKVAVGLGEWGEGFSFTWDRTAPKGQEGKAEAVLETFLGAGSARNDK